VLVIGSIDVGITYVYSSHRREGGFIDNLALLQWPALPVGIQLYQITTIFNGERNMKAMRMSTTAWRQMVSNMSWGGQ